MAGPTLARYEVIRIADNLDDQKTAAQIKLAIPSSITEEDYQIFFLSRLREIIFGNGTEHWYDDFQAAGIRPLRQLSQRRFQVQLVGSKDGVNRIFTTPEKFMHDPTIGLTIDVWHNGRRLMQGLNPSVGDYSVSESGGLGTGFDTINLYTFAPIERSCLVADYTQM